MAGFEPASARLDPRISTGLVAFFSHQMSHQRRQGSFSQSLGPESPSFAPLVTSDAATPAFCRPFYHRPESGVGGRDPFWIRLYISLFKQRGAERKHLCGWHLFCALIYRGRRLSACNPGPASSVEAFHPRKRYYNIFGGL